MHIKEYEVAMMDYGAFRIHKYLLLYIPPLLLAIGTFGNVLSFIILRQRAMSIVSTYFYLAVLAIADILVLYIGLLCLWISQLIEVDIRDRSGWLCKLTVFFGYVTSDVSVWVIVAVTVERYIAVCHPFRASSMCNVVRAKWVIFSLIMGFFLVNLHFMWTVELKHSIISNETYAQCEGGEQFGYLVSDIWPWLDTILYSFLPFIAISALNCLIIRQIIAAGRCRHTMQNGESSCIDDRRTARPMGDGSTKVTIMLLTVSCSFVLTTMPTNIFIISSLASYQQRDRQQIATYCLIKTITDLLMYANHSINFFLYCAAGQKFRHQLVKLVCSKRHEAYPMSDFSHYSTKLTKHRNSQIKFLGILDARDEAIPMRSTRSVHV